MTEIKIEKGVPIPEKTTSHPKYPWYEMEVGDSFYSPQTPTSMSSGAAYITKRTNMRFAMRKEGTGCRVWRVA